MGQSRPTTKPVVLVVEDEPLQHLMVTDLVQHAGYEVLEAWSADEAVRILESRADIAVLFTDIDMPGSMDGLKLAAAVRDRWPPIEIIIVSGCTSDIPATALPVGSVFFSKPFDLDKVTAQLHKMALA